jgi:hypothetical protein
MATDDERMSNGRNGAESDPTLSRFYRAAAQEKPPAHLDSAILAAARREVRARPRHITLAFLSSWRLPLSLAAVIAVSVSLVTLMVEKTGDPWFEGPRNAAQDAQTPAASVPAEVTEEKKPHPHPSPPIATPRSKNLLRGDPGEGEKATDPHPSSPSATPNAHTSAPTSLPEVADPNRHEQTSGRTAEPFPAEPSSAQQGQDRDRAAPGARLPAPPTKQAEPAVSAPSPVGPRPDETGASDLPAPRQGLTAEKAELPDSTTSRPFTAEPRISSEQSLKLQSEAKEQRRERAPLSNSTVKHEDEKPVLSAEEWIQKIEELRRQGRIAEAGQSLAEFKQRYPDYPLPEPDDR